MPRVGILSAIVNKQQLVPFLFRNYQLPPRDESYYAGSCSPHVWEAVRASSSAPFYFEEFHYNGDVHQDGGIIQNNPTGKFFNSVVAELFSWIGILSIIYSWRIFPNCITAKQLRRSMNHAFFGRTKRFNVLCPSALGGTFPKKVPAAALDQPP